MRRRPHLIRRAAAFASVVVLSAFQLACPPEEHKGTTEKKGEACARIGQSCEFAPGKLGSCVQRDDCAQPPCFVCQSQH